MAAPYTTPGVYIVEKNAFPNSVVQVETALPVFIGFTAKATYGGKDLTNVCTRVDSLKQFEDYFGTGFLQTFKLTEVTPTNATAGSNATGGAATGGAATGGAAAGNTQNASGANGAASTASDTLVAASQMSLSSAPGSTYQLSPDGDTPLYYLYNSIRLFYLNGGSTCYIISVGNDKTEPKVKLFTDAIGTLVYEQDPTMLLCPDALRLEDADYNTVMTTMLSHCADVQSRVALFDVRDGAVTKVDDITPKIEKFRTGVGQNFLSYGVAYFPWVNTAVISDTDVSFYNLNGDSLEALRKVLNPTDADLGTATRKSVEVQVPVLVKSTNAGQAGGAANAGQAGGAANAGQAGGNTANANAIPQQNIFDQAIALLAKDVTVDFDAASAPEGYTNAQAVADKRQAIDNSLRTLYPDYKLIIKAMATYLSTLPVSPAMAGVYTAVDSNRGVWKAPANWSLNAVTSPTVSLSDRDQGRLNVDPTTGKSVNVIRAFKGMGVLVWGARTLDGNSQDWRYINVRRTMIMIEQSVKLAAHNYVFEPNDANTWVTVKSAIDSFLFNLWKQGALAGVVPADAYQVLVGLGSTMTADDILNGYMNVTVLVAIVRPAEFIELTFQQQMQKS
jgi:phage tail sheath protein FI